jgi:hypothetical protein
MEPLKNAIPVEVHDKDGNLQHIEFHDSLGKFEFKADWDPRDEQTSENREEFRRWAYLMAKRMGFVISK